MSKQGQLWALPRAAQVAVCVFGMIGISGLIGAILTLELLDYSYFWLLLFLAVVTGQAKVRLIAGSSLSLITTVVLIAVMMLGTPAGTLVGICGVFVQSIFPSRKFVFHQLIFNLGMIVLTTWLSSAAYYKVARDVHAMGIERLTGALVASIVYYLGCSVCVSMIVGLSSKKSILRLWHDNFLYTAPSFVVAGLLSFLVSEFIGSERATLLLVVAPVLYLCYYSYRVYIESLEKEKQHATELFNSTLSTLALAIDAKDKNTHGHIQRVQKYSRAIAEAMRLSELEVKGIAAAALLHDIGKLAIPEYILSKEGPLTPEEMRKMRLHPQLGAEIVSNIKFRYPVTDSILAHHERFDGKGYPNGLAGKAIPLGARVLAVADVFDAYTSGRLESAETINGAMEALRQGSGTYFDPEIVRVWESIYRDVVNWGTTPSPEAYSGIERVTSDVKILEKLTKSLAKATTTEQISQFVSDLITNRFPQCVVELKVGAHEGVPVKFGDQTIATISVTHTAAPFNDDEVALIRAVAEKISGPFNKVLALEIAQREAAVDKLTGLANRRGLELMAAKLIGKPVSVVVVDVNCLKSINDNFGHKAGDAVLVRIAAHLRAAFNDAQLTCRLGGDEFVVFSEADRRTLRTQIRNFRRMVVWDPAHEPYKRMLFGASCGLGTTPVDGKNIEQVMHCADKRMYAIKARFKRFADRPVADCVV